LLIDPLHKLILNQKNLPLHQANKKGNQELNMKTSALLFAALTGAVSAQDQRFLATLAEKWNLTDPTFAFANNTFNLTFPVTNFIINNMTRFSIWTAPGCQSENGTALTDNTTIWKTPPSLIQNQQLINGDQQDSGTFGDRAATIMATFNPETVSKASIYKDTSTAGQASAEIRFCMRFGLWTSQANTPVEVNFLETLVTLNVDLTDGFQIGNITVAPKNRLTRTANQAYKVKGYECTPSGTTFTELTDTQKSRSRSQGEIITVCVEPDTEAKNDGIYMASIDKFDFTRGSSIAQSAIVNNGAAANLLTTYTPGDCKGAAVCSFSTILFAQFYATPGTVGGAGSASMQFGNAKARRQLRAEQERDLQAAESAGASEFELNFEVAQGEAGTGSGAVSTSMGAAMTISALAAVAALL